MGGSHWLDQDAGVLLGRKFIDLHDVTQHV